MKIDILTLFPEICRALLGESIMKRAQENKIVDLRIHNLRDWTNDKQHVVDDVPFGGGREWSSNRSRCVARAAKRRPTNN